MSVMRGPGLLFLTLLIAPTGLAGAQLSSSNTTEPDDCRQADALVAFVRGLGAFRTGHLEQAAAFFDRALECHPEHGSALYWLGVTDLRRWEPGRAAAAIAKSLAAKEAPRADRWRILAHLGAAQHAAHDEQAAGQSLEEAHKSLGKVRDLTANDALAMLLLGRSLVALGRLEAGNDAIERARGLDPRIEEHSETIAPPRYRGPFWPPQSPFRREGRLGLSSSYDSNPNLLDDELVLRALDGELIEGGESDSVQDLDFRLALYRLDQRGRDDRNVNGWSLGWTLEGNRSLHEEFDFLDLGQALTVVHAAWGKDQLSYLSGPLGYVRVPYGDSRLSVLLQAGYLHTRLDGGTYFNAAAAGVSMTFRETRFTDTRVELSFQDLDFAQAASEDRDRSGSLLYVDVSQGFYLKRRDRFIRLGLAGGERDAGRAFARSLVEAYVEASVPFKPAWSLLLSGSVRRDDFDHSESNLFVPTTGLSSSSGPPREDTVRRAAATLVWSIRPSWQVFASLSHTDRESELELPAGIPGLDYDRTSSSVGFVWFFGSGR